ncbi:MAG: hypothetical protein H5U40_12970, partial [Polyangiaceae bacterium]|nr:hypothetical protein [Polyangiaceae bacterium]
MMRAILFALTTVAVLVFPASSNAWQCLEFGCPRWQGTIPVGLGPLSADLEAIAPGTTVLELDRAITDWALLSCAAVPFGEPSPTQATLGDLDGISAVGFIEADWPHDASAIGITSVNTTACNRVGGCIVEADAVFNAVNFDWVTVRGALPEVNAYSIILHELGHYIGLGHSTSSDA